jgi:elongation factor G
MYLTLSAVDVAHDERLREALAQIAGQGPGVSINAHPESTYTLSGNSESRLESICDRLRGEYKCAINVSTIKAALLETIRKQAEAEGKYIRQTGASGNYGHCQLRIEPNEAGKGYEFINDIKGGVVPKEYIAAIDHGIQGAMELGILAGFPVVDVKVTLFDGSYHEVDSNEMAFKFAGSMALKEAAKKACPIIMEPVMAVEIEVPERLGATIRHQVHGHRGRIESERIVEGLSEIKAVVPLSELLNLASKGLAQFPMEFAGYEAVPDDGSSTDSGTGVTANKPNSPRPRRRSDVVPIEHEDD